VTPCLWCRVELPATPGRRYCSQRCRQAAFRLRQRRQVIAAAEAPGRFCYADPPYPGLARRYYGREPDFGGEVDHPALIAQLKAGGFTGWALSTSMRALRQVLPLCPEGAHVLPWCKPGGVPKTTRGLHVCWEPLIVVGGRQVPPGRRDFLVAHPARGAAGCERAELPGRKPLAFCAFLFDSLGMRPGDELVDLFPGTGIISRAWAALSSAASADAPELSLLEHGDVSPAGVGDTSSPGVDDAPRVPSPLQHDDAESPADPCPRGQGRGPGRVQPNVDTHADPCPLGQVRRDRQ
jgi:hypothetical protein